MTPTTPKPTVSTHTTLYRFMDGAGELLYVGIASNPGRRFEQHHADKPWWSEVAHSDMVHYATRQEAVAAEREAIRSERPKYNVTHNAAVRGQVVVRLWCAVCDSVIDDDNPGHLTVIDAEVRAHAAHMAEADRFTAERGGSVDLNNLLAGPDQATWRAYHHGCDPNPDSGDYWIGHSSFKTWQDVLSRTAHLMGKQWLDDTNWVDVLYGVVNNTGPIRTIPPGTT